MYKPIFISVRHMLLLGFLAILPWTWFPSNANCSNNRDEDKERASSWGEITSLLTGLLNGQFRNLKMSLFNKKVKDTTNNSKSMAKYFTGKYNAFLQTPLNIRRDESQFNLCELTEKCKRYVLFSNSRPPRLSLYTLNTYDVIIL